MGTHPIFESDFDCLTDWDMRVLFAIHLQLIAAQGPSSIIDNISNAISGLMTTEPPRTQAEIEQDKIYEAAAQTHEFHGPQTENANSLLNRFALVVRAIGGETFTEDMLDCIEHSPSNVFDPAKAESIKKYLTGFQGKLHKMVVECSKKFSQENKPTDNFARLEEYAAKYPMSKLFNDESVDKLIEQEAQYSTSEYSTTTEPPK